MWDMSFVINLDRRPDRLTEFMDSWDREVKTPIEVVSAIDGKRCPCPDWYSFKSNGWGCGQSHMRVLEDALNQGLDSYACFEDDCCFVEGYADKLSSFFAEILDVVPGFEMLYLGGQLLKTMDRGPRKISDNVYTHWNINRMHAYVVHSRAYEKLYRFLHSDRDRDLIIDHRIGCLHESGEITPYCPAEWLCGQRASFSNLTAKTSENDEFYVHPKAIYDANQMMAAWLAENPVLEVAETLAE